MLPKNFFNEKTNIDEKQNLPKKNVAKKKIAKLNSNFNLNYNWVEYSINFVFFSTTRPATRTSSDNSTISPISTSTELKITLLTALTKLNLSLAQLSTSLFHMLIMAFVHTFVPSFFFLIIFLEILRQLLFLLT